MPQAGTLAWTAWHLEHSFKPDDAAIIEYICTMVGRSERLVEYARTCHLRGWAGWQATLAWSILETVCEPLGDDIPF